MLDNDKALLFIRGELPVCDNASITIYDRLTPTNTPAEPHENETQYELLSNEELEAIYELDKKHNEAS